jgi:hypothetical protein
MVSGVAIGKRRKEQERGKGRRKGEKGERKNL